MNSPKNKLSKLLKTLAVGLALTGAIAAQNNYGGCPLQKTSQQGHTQTTYYGNSDQYQPTHGTYGEYQPTHGTYGEYQPTHGTHQPNPSGLGNTLGDLRNHWGNSQAGTSEQQATFGNQQAQPTSPTAQTAEEQIANQILHITNQKRIQNGLSPLSMNPALNQAAKSHSEEMLTLNYFSHNSPTVGRRTVGDRMRQAGVSPRVQAENIFMCQGFPTAQLAQLSMDQWMQSPGHRRNILRGNVTHIGIGVIERNGKYYATQVFGGGM